jgi:non-ribosomal peptide synthetase component F
LSVPVLCVYFDVSLGDVFATLIYGGCLCIPSEQDRMNNLTGSFRSLQANHASLTPTMASYLRPHNLKGIKVLIVMGESLTRKVVNIWVNLVSLINMYGPAEATVYGVGQSVSKGDNPKTISLGVNILEYFSSCIANPH